MTSNDNNTYRFGRHELNPRERRLLSGGVPVALAPKVFDTLVLLVARAGQVISKEELMRQLWPRGYVEESNLTKHIWLIRRALGEGDDATRYIETVSKLGYRFIVPVTVHAPGEAAALVGPEAGEGTADASAPAPAQALPAVGATPRRRPGRRAGLVAAGVALALVAVYAAFLGGTRSRGHDPQAGASVAAPARSIAVLPFTDRSEAHDQEYFSDGLSEELIDHLARVSELRVPARTSSFYFKGRSATIPQIASALGVAHVLEGSVRKSGNTLRVTAELIRADNGYHVWSETYERPLTDVFAVQDEIARAVVSALKVRLLNPPAAAGRPTADPEAYTQYLIGRQALLQPNGSGYRRAMSAFRAALDHDAGYGAAWAGLAEATDWAADEATSAAALAAGQDTARQAAERAVALRPDLPDGYLVRGMLKSTILWDFAGAGEDLERAVALAPENADAQLHYARWVLQPMGRLDEAVAAIRRAIDLDPLNAQSWRALGITYTFRGDLARARDALNRSLKISPVQNDAQDWLIVGYLMEHHPELAAAMPDRPASEVFRLHAGALIEHDLGHDEASLRFLGELKARHAFDAAYQIAEVHAWRGEPDLAFEWLHKAYLQRDGGLASIKVDPLVRGLRADPRYGELLRTMKLPPEGPAPPG